MLDRRHALVLGACSLAGAALTPRRAVAQPKYPDRPIRLVIPFVPGGIPDVVGRQWAHAMQALLGPVVVENKPGGSGIVGTASVAQAQPDGYTILLGATGPLIVNSLAASHPPYDPTRDFAPIAILVVAPVGIVVNPSLPARTLKDVADYAKQNPGKLSYGSAGVGTINHLTGELFKLQTGTDDIVHVPYRGSGQSIGDLVSGQILMAIVGVTGQVLGLHQAGKLKMLAVTTPTRMTAAPDIPTAVEQGLPDMIAQAFFGLFAPAGTPDAIVDQISAATRTAMADDGFRDKLIASGF
jgi:tripartite-type tricarboxylate transporter receptor subunit TctC